MPISFGGMLAMHEQKIAFYSGPAGGWGALNSVKNTLLHQNIALKGAKTLLSANQPDGFDCPGCAWPDRNHASTFGRRPTQQVLAHRTAGATSQRVKD